MINFDVKKSNAAVMFLLSMLEMVCTPPNLMFIALEFYFYKSLVARRRLVIMVWMRT
jgi:hypothetical protein